jgi:hypothetical protein
MVLEKVIEVRLVNMSSVFYEIRKSIAVLKKVGYWN